MLYEPARHEPLRALPWNESQAWAAIERIVTDAESRFTEDRYWPLHPLDVEDGHAKAFDTSMYDGACGIFWALNYLETVGLANVSRRHVDELDGLLLRNRAALGASLQRKRASFMLGDTPILMMSFDEEPTAEREGALDALIAGNTEHPARELMLGSPGTLLAALFLYERTGKERWAELFRFTAGKLWSQLEWSPQHRCSYWTQNLSARQSTYLDGVHGFVATALPLIRGRQLLDAEAWNTWERCIVNTVQRTADRLGGEVNWRPELDDVRANQKKLLQFCHGAPGFIVCLADLPSTALDDLLLAAGQTIWSAGPLIKGSNLCHGTGGNGYSLLKLYQRTNDSLWLERARSFAMHGIAQTREAALRYGQARYALWTGDLGFAIYLWDCLRAEAQFPTLDVFYGGTPTVPIPAEAVAPASLSR